ncbi:unnamed protein product [Adineta steineri]|uniref:Transglutaminase-like domain-containing protein n=1 Tax=Adineta steineri TaxID=433720 RepID=A0A815ISR7_9BILA|nr:unnamed protein product [Adineta steineri]CAF3486067.1 unnamed protein product [Adineta steineri]
MGCGASKSNQPLVVSAPIPPNNTSAHLETPSNTETAHSTVETHEASIQTSLINLRDDLTKTSLSPQKTFTPINKIELIPDQRQTISEENINNPRKDLFSNNKHRDYIDNQCSNVQSIAELVKKIESYSSNDLIRAWLIFYWITKYIRYVDGHEDNAADVVFRTRTGVCRGFTHLFSECCRLLNIKCVDVPGYVKENWFRIGDALQQATHVWNAVKLSGYWYLLDSTWGAGSASENKLEEFYFLTPPDQMIYTHLPTEDMWQLLSPTITKQQFLDLPIIKSVYYRLNLKLIFPQQCVIETSQSLFEVIIKTPSPDVTLTSTMKAGSDEYPDSHKLCQYDHRDQLTRCYFSPTNDGTYDLTIFGKTKEEGTYQGAIHMRLKVHGLLTAPLFPTLYGPFKEHQCTLIEPFRRVLYKDERITIRIRIPDAITVSVKNGTHNMSTHGFENQILTKEVVVEGDVIVYAIFDRTETLQGVCKFDMA